MPAPTVAYVAGGRLYLCRPGTEAKEIDSAFGQEIYNRSLSSHAKNAWKEGEGGSPFSGRMLWGGGSSDPSMLNLQIAGVTRGATSDQICYLLDTGTVGGLLSYDLTAGKERRLFHKSQFRAMDLATSDDRGRIACAIEVDNGLSNIAIMQADGSNLRQITEGDSIDRSPSWIPGEGERLLFQSAGIGWSAEGIVAGQGPYRIEQLDLARGDIETLVEHDELDLLSPRKDADGHLYYIERPYQGPESFSVWRFLLDIILFPFRLLRALFAFLNVFSLLFSGKPLATGGRRQEQAQQDLHRMMLWGRMVDAQRNLRRENGEADAGALVPSSWRLMRQTPEGETSCLARGVVAFDLAPDGTIVYTNGSTIYHLSQDGEKAELASGRMIHTVVALGS